MKTEPLKVVLMDVGSIKPNPANPKKHWDDGIDASIDTVGFLDPIEVDENFMLLAGEGRWRSAMRKGMKKIPTIVHTGLTKAQKRKYLLASNHLTIRGGYDDEILRSQFELQELLSAGFDEKDLEKIFKQDEAEDDFDADAEVAQIEKPTSKLGQVYQLREHRLMCGDATKDSDVAKLMNGEQADMVWTDPPYNINYSGRGKNTSNKIKNDDMDVEAFKTFLTESFKRYHDYSKKKAALYTCYASRTHREFEDSLNAAGFVVRSQIIWVKKVASMGWGDYRWKHEPILYCVKRGSTVNYYGDRSQYTEWSEELSDEELLKKVKAMVTKEEAGESTVWRMHREQKYDHPTQKPIKLVQIAIQNSSKRDDLIMDLFGGSGSVIVAADKVGRRCNVMELDPKYIDVILKRWELYSGEKAVLLQ